MEHLRAPSSWTLAEKVRRSFFPQTSPPNPPLPRGLPGSSCSPARRERGGLGVDPRLFLLSSPLSRIQNLRGRTPISQGEGGWGGEVCGKNERRPMANLFADRQLAEVEAACSKSVRKLL